MRAGLIAKKRTVRGKGKTFSRVYWVKNEPETLRLRRVRQEVVLPKETPQASVKRWFEEHGLGAMTPKTLAYLTTFFPKPDKTPFTADDLESMIGDPGLVRIKAMQYQLDSAGNPIKDYATGTFKVTPMVDAGGSPVWFDTKLRWQFSQMSATEDRVSLTATLMSEGNPPTAIGSVRRIFTKNADGSVSVDHTLLKIDDRFQGEGLGTGILQKMMSTYPKLGVSIVTISSAWIGRYTWATMGFEMNSDAKLYMSGGFEDFAKELTGEVSFSRYFPNGVSPLLRPDKEPYTAKELQHYVDFTGPSWKAASAEIPVWDNEKEQVVYRKLGKEFLLHAETDGWAGSLSLDKNNPSYKRLHKYLDIVPLSQQASVLRTQARELRMEATRLEQEQPEQARALLRKEAGLIQEATLLEQRSVQQQVQQQARQAAYQGIEQQARQQAELNRREKAVLLSRKLPIDDALQGELDASGFSPLLRARLAEVDQALQGKGGSVLERTAYVLERELIYAEAHLLRAKKEASLGTQEEQRQKQVGLRVLEAQRDLLVDQWLEERRFADASVEGSQRWQVVQSASEKGRMDQERIVRNINAAEVELSAANAKVRRLEQEGASSQVLAQAREDQASAYGTLQQIKLLSDGLPFDEQEEEELRQKQKGIEASRKLGNALQSMRAQQANRRASLRSTRLNEASQKNVELARVVEQLAQEELTQLRARGAPASEIRAAQFKIAASRNLRASIEATQQKEPESQEEAQRWETHQESLLQGESSLPANLRDLYRLARARRAS